MKKLIALALSLVMALSLSVVAWGATMTESELQTLLNAGGTVILTDNVTVENGLSVPAGVTVTLDLAGYTISQTKAQTAGYQMLENKGNLTITDSVGGGKMTYTDSGNGGEYISDTIYNRGTLVINGGTIENLSSATVASNGYPHAVDTYSGDRDTSVTINGGTIYCANYSAIRMFCVSATNKADLVINGGTIKGAIDMQNGTAAAALGSLTINDGTFETTANANNIRFANWNGGATTYGITASIDGGSFDGGITSAYVPAAANWDSKIITGGTFTDDVSDYVADGSSAVVSGGKLVVSVGNTGSTNSYDDDDVTIIAKDGSKVAIADGAKVVMTQESKKTVNGKFASLVPAHFTYNGVKYVVCHEASATHVVTVKGVKYYTCAFNGVVPSVEKDGGVLYTAPKKATCGKVGVNEDKYVVIDNVYYLLSDSGTNYALVGGKMVVYSNTTGTMQEHVYDAVKSELKYNTDRTVATFKCAVCNNTIPVVAKKPNFATNYTAITLGNEGTYYYVSNTTGTTVSGGTTTGGTVNSADTFDAGIAMYVGMSVMAAAGSAVVIGKKKD